MTNSLMLWSPGVPALAVYMHQDMQEVEWDQYLNLLATRLENLAEGEEDPKNLLEREWFDQMGGDLNLPRKVGQIIHSPEFLEWLSGRHDLHEGSFPMEVGTHPDLETEGLPSNLMEWVRDLK